MTLSATRHLCLATVFLGLIAGGPVVASNPADLCFAAARTAAAQSGVPLRVLLALTLTETGRAGGDDALAPWPWTLNSGGKGFWFDNREAARQHLEAVLAEGNTNVDVGCFQLNHRWHGQAFDSIDAMLDPDRNALYAARFVQHLYQVHGDWTDAAAAYHSGTPDVARRYLRRFEPIYAALGDPPPDVRPTGPERESERENRFPLLLAGAPRTAGSLVPMLQSAEPLIGAP